MSNNEGYLLDADYPKRNRVTNRIGHCERDPEMGLLWYSRSYMGDINSI
jgi:hypothetical protein